MSTTQENNQIISGQTGAKQVILENPGVFLNPEQPLIAAVTITKDDVRRQEERVKRARLRLQVQMGLNMYINIIPRFTHKIVHIFLF